MEEQHELETKRSLVSRISAQEVGKDRLVTRSLPSWFSKALFVVVGMFIFILALRLLSKGAAGIGPVLKTFMRLENSANTLGFGWLFAYVVLSGSPVAGIALTFFDGGVITAPQTFTMITGSRLGASFIVLFIGFLYYLRGQKRAASISMGVIALTVTATTYLPALGMGYWMLDNDSLDSVRLGLPSSIASFIEVIFDPIVNIVAAYLSPWIIFILGVGALLLAFNLLDRALPQVHAEHSAFGHIGGMVYRPIAMLALGMAVTTITLSVSVSISILVPLSAKGFIRRENALPYIMGANITTFIDTLLAALLLAAPFAFTIVLVQMVSVTFVSVFIILFFYRSYERFVLGLLDRIIESNLALLAFMVIMIVAPIILLLI